MQIRWLTILGGILLSACYLEAREEKPAIDQHAQTLISREEIVTHRRMLFEAIDPLLPPLQRRKFLVAAGSDDTLTQEEFESDGRRSNGFVREYDHWNLVKRFDRDGDGRIAWVEADAYRTSVREVLLTQFDRNKNGRFDDEERPLVIRTIRDTKEYGRILEVAAAKTPSKNLQDRPLVEDEHRPPIFDPGLRNADLDGDGRVSPEEQRAMDTRLREARIRQSDYNKATILRMFDMDGNEQMDAEEIETFKQWKLLITQQQFDKNRNGRMEPEELAAWDTSPEKQFYEYRHQFDTNGDGLMEFSEEEVFRKEYNAKYQAELNKIASKSLEYPRFRRENFAKFDANGDGELDRSEDAALIDAWIEWARQGE